MASNASPTRHSGTVIENLPRMHDDSVSYARELWIIIGVGFLVIYTLWVLWDIWRRGHTHTAQPGEIPMQQIQLKERIPPVVAAGTRRMGDQCPICLVEYDDNDELSVIPACQHGFHVVCLQGWVNESSHRTCPTCRGSVGV